MLLSEIQSRLLSELTAGMDRPTMMWLSGYLAGLGQQGAQAANVAAPASAAQPGVAVTVLYGSQTGNARRIATELAEQLRVRGMNARLFGADAYPKRALKEERCLFVVVSTERLTLLAGPQHLFEGSRLYQEMCFRQVPNP